MAYENPDAADLKGNFPRFAAVADETVEFWLTRARRQVDESWTEGDYQMGQILLACHLMTLQGLGTGAEAEASAQGVGDYKTIRTGSVTLERFDRDSGAATGTMGSTSYGRQWLELARANRGGPRVMATGILPYSGGHFVDGGS